MLVRAADNYEIKRINEELSEVLKLEIEDEKTGQTKVDYKTAVSKLDNIFKQLGTDANPSDLLKKLMKIKQEDLGYLSFDSESEGAAEEFKARLAEYVRLRDEVERRYRENEAQPYSQKIEALKNCTPDTYEAAIKEIKTFEEEMVRPIGDHVHIQIYYHFIEKMNDALIQAITGPQESHEAFRQRALAYHKIAEDIFNNHLTFSQKDKIRTNVNPFIDVTLETEFLNELKQNQVIGALLKLKDLDDLDNQIFKLFDSKNLMDKLATIFKQVLSYYPVMGALYASMGHLHNDVMRVQGIVIVNWSEFSLEGENADLVFLKSLQSECGRYYRDALDNIAGMFGAMAEQIKYALEKNIIDVDLDTLVENQANGIVDILTRQEGGDNASDYIEKLIANVSIEIARIVKANGSEFFTENLIKKVVGSIVKALAKRQINLALKTVSQQMAAMIERNFSHHEIKVVELNVLTPLMMIVKKMLRDALVRQAVDRLNAAREQFNQKDPSLEEMIYFADLVMVMRNDINEKIGMINETFQSGPEAKELERNRRDDFSKIVEYVYAECARLYSENQTLLVEYLGKYLTNPEMKLGEMDGVLENLRRLKWIYPSEEYVENVQLPELLEQFIEKIKKDLDAMLALSKISEDEFVSWIERLEWINRLVDSGQIAPETRDELYFSIEQNIIGKNKILQYVRPLEKYGKLNRFENLRHARNQMIGDPIRVDLTDVKDQEGYRQALEEKITPNVQTNLRIHAPSDPAQIDAFFKAVDDLMNRYPLVVMDIVQQKVETEETSGMFAMVSQFFTVPTFGSDETSALEKLAARNDRRIEILQYIDQMVRENQAINFDAIDEKYTGINPAYRTMFKKVYFMRVLMRDWTFPVNDIIKCLRALYPDNNENDYPGLLSPLGESSDAFCHRRLMELAAHYRSENPDLAIAFLKMVPVESKVYSDALRAQLSLSNHSEEQLMMASLLLARKEENRFGPVEENITLVVSVAKKYLNDINVLRQFMHLLATVGAADQFCHLFMELSKEDILESRKLFQELVGKYWSILLKNSAVLKTYLPMIENIGFEDLKELDDKTLKGEIHLLIEQLKKDSIPTTNNYMNAIILRINALEHNHKLNEDFIREVLNSYATKLNLNNDEIQLVLSLYGKLLPHSNQWGLRQANYQKINQLISFAITLAKCNPVHAVTIITAMIKALPVDLQTAMQNNHPGVYRMFKPIRDLLKGKELPLDLTGYQVLHKKKIVGRAALLVQEAVPLLANDRVVGAFSDNFIAASEDGFFSDSDDEDSRLRSGSASTEASADLPPDLVEVEPAVAAVSPDHINQIIQRIAAHKYNQSNIDDCLRHASFAISQILPYSNEPRLQDALADAVCLQLVAIENYFKVKMNMAYNECCNANFLTRPSSLLKLDRSKARAADVHVLLNILSAASNLEEFSRDFGVWQQKNSKMGSVFNKIETPTHVLFQTTLNPQALYLMKNHAKVAPQLVSLMQTVTTSAGYGFSASQKPFEDKSVSAGSKSSNRGPSPV